MTKSPRNLRSAVMNFAMASGSMSALLIFSPAMLLKAQYAPTQQQADAVLPSFEVASIKPHAPDVMTSGQRTAFGMGASDPSHWSAVNMTAKNLVTEAYGVQGFQVSGGPAWIDTERFDISAKVDDATAAQLEKLTRHEQNQRMDLMLRSLLLDRFKLQVTRETKDAPAYLLVVAKGGPKFKESTATVGEGRMSVSNGQVVETSTAITMTNFAGGLTGRLGRAVIDQTGLTGKYDITWHHAMQTGLSTDASATDTAAPTMLDALQDQLGLKLESTRAPLETITIDHIEEPSPN